MTLLVKEAAGIARSHEVVHNGIPLDRRSNLVDVSQLHMEDAAGNPVDAQLEVLSRWGGGRSSAQPIQWLLATFATTVPASGTQTYRLVPGPHSNATHLTVTDAPASITVNTGVARFTISKTAFTVFDSVVAMGGVEHQVAGGNGSATMVVDGLSTMTAQPPTEVALEHMGDLFATVKVAGYFDHAPYANIPWRYVVCVREFQYPCVANDDVTLDIDVVKYYAPRREVQRSQTSCRVQGRGSRPLGIYSHAVLQHPSPC